MRLYTTADLLSQSSNIIQRSFSGNLLRIEPNGSFPIFGLAGLARKKQIRAVAHSYYSKRAVFPSVVVDGAHLAGDTAITVDDSSEVKPGSVLMMYLVTPGTYTAPELMRVVAVPDGVTITVTRGVGSTTPTAIADNAVLFEVGNAYGEGSNMPQARSISSEEHTNFTQIFRDSWNVTRTARQVALEPNIMQEAENKEDGAFFHAASIEWSTLFGRKQATTDPLNNNNPLRYMDGIESLVTQHAPGNINAAGATTTFKQLEQMLHPTLDFKTNRGGSSSRTLLVGSQAMETIQEIGRNSGYFELQADNTMFGTQFKRFKTTRGNWDMIEHPLLNSNDYLKSMAIIADMSSFDYRFLQDTIHQNTAFDTNGTDATSGVFTTELTMEILNPLAWGIIYNLQAAA